MKGKLISFVICEASEAKTKGEAVEIPTLKSAPHYFAKTVPQQFILSQDEIKIGSRTGTLFLKTCPPNFFLAEARFDISDIFFEDVVSFKEEVINYCGEYLKKRGGKEVDELSEEYTAYIVTDYAGDPEKFFSNKERIAGLLKSEKLPLDPKEIEYTLSFQLKYAKDDLVLVDWDGAFIFDPGGDYESTLALLELANLQLLRYRILDKEVDQRLQRISRLIEKAPARSKFFLKPGDIHQALRLTTFLRSRSISDFQALEREIKLIGDWYSTRLYELVGKKFRLDEWGTAIKDKLDSLEDVYTIASENFTISWGQRSRIIELVGWYVLLLGWLVLLVLDIYFYKFD